MYVCAIRILSDPAALTGGLIGPFEWPGPERLVGASADGMEFDDRKTTRLYSLYHESNPKKEDAAIYPPSRSDLLWTAYPALTRI